MTPNTVLVIENESATMTMVERSLQNEGYTLYNAVDADSGLRMAQETVPSLILLNLAVEGANGLEICKTIHTEETLKDIPLVLLTLREGKFDPIYTKLYGIVNFLKKPFTPEQLLENVREFAPFQAGAGAPPPRPAPATPMKGPDKPAEQEPAYAGLDEPEEQDPAYDVFDEPPEQEPAYGNIDEPLKPAADFGSVDEPMEETSGGGMDDDVYTLDEDVSLEDAQAGLEDMDTFDTLDRTPPAESFRQDMQAGPDDDSLTLENEVFDLPEDDDFSMLEDDAPDGPETGPGQMDEAPQELPDDDSLDFPGDDPPAAMAAPDIPDMPGAEDDEIPDGTGLSLDGMGFDTPSEPMEPIEFEMPVEEDEPAPKKHGRSSSSLKKGKEKKEKEKKAKEPRKRASSSVNRPKGSNKRPVVLLLVLVPVLLLAAGASYYFFLYDSGTAHVVQVTDSNPAPVDDPVSQQPVPDVPEPLAPQADVPPPAGVAPAPQPLAVPKPAEAMPAPAPVETPKPAPPRPSTPAQATAPQVPTPKPPPPRVPAPAQTAQAGVPAGSNYTVQFGVFSAERNAQDLINRLGKKGIKAFIKPRKSSSGKFLYYVLLEDGFKTKDAASDKASEIKRRTGFDATVHKF